MSSQLHAMCRHDIPASGRVDEGSWDRGGRCTRHIHDMEPGPYVAWLLISQPSSYRPTTHETLWDLEHHLMLHEDGSVTESGYISQPCQAIHLFEEPRVWDPALLRGYRLRRENETNLRPLREYRRV